MTARSIAGVAHFTLVTVSYRRLSRGKGDRFYEGNRGHNVYSNNNWSDLIALAKTMTARKNIGFESSLPEE